MPVRAIASTPSVLRQAQTSVSAEVQQLLRSGMVLAGAGSELGEILPPSSQVQSRQRGCLKSLLVTGLSPIVGSYYTGDRGQPHM